MDTRALSNSVLPSIDPVAQAVGSQELGRDEFLRMLIAQLENQDPLDPQDPTEFTAQLAQFSTLEQLVSIRSAIESLGSSGEAPGVVELSALIGREIVAETSQIEVGRPTDPVPGFEVSLSQGASRVRVDIADASGRVVRRLDLGNLGQGDHPVAWDGLSDAGAPLPPGLYSLAVDAGDGSTPTNATTRVTGRVTSVLPGREGEAGAVMLGRVPIPLDGVAEVREVGAGS